MLHAWYCTAKYNTLILYLAYAQVVVAHNISNGVDYAMKIVEKSHVKKHNKIQAVMTERKILSTTNHPLINRLFYSFQDRSSLYFVLELCSSQDLNQYINSQFNKHKDQLDKASSHLPASDIDVDTSALRACDLSVAVFYTAQIAVALEYIHGLGIVHRDVKVGR
jgi:3-phosphoinositide dependent protein kinase-1